MFSMLSFVIDCIKLVKQIRVVDTQMGEVVGGEGVKLNIPLPDVSLESVTQNTVCTGGRGKSLCFGAA